MIKHELKLIIAGGTAETIWSADNDTGVKNIVHTRDQTGVNKLEFDVYACHNKFKNIKPAYNNIILLYNGFLIDDALEISYVKTDRIKGIKHVIAYGGLHDFVKIPCFYDQWGDFEFWPTLSWITTYGVDGYNFFPGMLEMYSLIQDKTMFNVTRTAITARLSDEYFIDMDEDDADMSAVEYYKAIRDKGNLLIRTKSSHRDSQGKYRIDIVITSAKDAKGSKSSYFNTFTVEEPAAISRIEDIEDASAYYTHSAVYKDLAPYSDESVHRFVSNAMEKKAYGRVDTYGIHYKWDNVSKSDDMSDALNSLDVAVQSSEAKSITISINSFLVEQSNEISVLDCIEFAFPVNSIFYDINGKYIVTEIKRCIDNPQKTTIKIE